MMENRVGVAGGSHSGDNKTTEDKILAFRAVEKAACSSDEMKDADGGDVFEMATAETPRSLSEDILDEDVNVEKVGNLDGSLELDRNSNAGSENDNFEEAIGVPADAAMAEVAYEQTPYVKLASDEMNGSGKVGLVDNEEHRVKEVSNVGVIDDKKVSQDADVVDGGSDQVVEKSEKDIPEIVNTEKKLAHGNSATGDTNNDGVQVHDELENGGATKVGLGDCDSQQKDKSNGDILHQDDNSEAAKDTSNNLDREHQDKKGKELEDKSALLSSEHQHDKVEKLKDNLVAFDVQPEDISVEELKEETSVSQGPGHLDDTGQELKTTLSDLDMENQEDTGCEMKDVSDSINSEHLGESCKLGDNLHPTVKESPIILETGRLSSVENPVAKKGEKVQFGSLPSVADSAAEKTDKVQSGSLPSVEDSVADENVQSGSLLSVEDPVAEKGEHVLPGSLPSVEDSVGENVLPGSLPSMEDSVADKGENVQPGSLPYIGDSVAEKGENFQSGSLPSVEDPVAEKGEKVKPQSLPSVVDSVVEKIEKVQFVASDLGRKNFKGSQHQSADENVEVSNGVANMSEQKVGKDGALKERIQMNRDQEIKPEVDVSSSSGKSANPAAVPGRPAGLGRGAPLLEPAPRIVQQTRANGNVTQMQNQLTEESMNVETEENDETREKLQMIRVKFLRLAHRLGQTPHNVVVAQVLYRLGLAEQLRGRNGGRVAAFSFDRASAMAEQLEAAGQEPLDFSCTIMVLGKTGVGKSATINSIFDEVKFGTDAFQLGTKKVQDVVGTVQGIKVRVIDTPGLLPSWSDQRQNEKILHSVKRFIKKTPPDIVLYLDRLDMQSRDFSDMPLLRTITEIFGPFIWFNAIVVLTHAASAPPEGPNGTTTSYDMFVTQRSHVVQQAIRQAAGDMRLMNPVSLVENHSACRTNRAGQRVLPNGQVWKPHLLLLSFASKILAEANALLKLQDSPAGKPFATRTRAPPLPFLLSSLLQSRPQLKLPEEQFGDDDDTLDDDLDESSDSDVESEYDGLPPFKRMTKFQLAKLTKAQRKAYYDELEYREKLFMKKQLKEEKKRRRMAKKMAASAKDFQSDYIESVEEESGGAASVPVPMPDLALPASFDSENPTHRYRCLDSSNQWLVRPVLEPHGWDHDVGYEGINVERLFVVKDNIPVSFSGQVTKDKKDANLHMEIASSVKHGEGKATSLGFDMQTVGKDIAYTLRSESRFCNYSINKATAGLSATILGDALTAGLKIEDKLIVKKRLHVVVSGGAVTGRGDVAYGGSLEATLRDKDHPLGRSLTTFGLSIMDWHGDLAIGWNFQSQIPIGRFTNLIGRVNVNNRGSGQVSVRLNSSEQLQIALIGLAPLLRKLLGYSQ